MVIHPFWFLGLSLSFDYIVPHYREFVKRFFKLFSRAFALYLFALSRSPYSVTHFGEFVKPFFIHFSRFLALFSVLIIAHHKADFNCEILQKNVILG